jgi:alanine racemase
MRQTRNDFGRSLALVDLGRICANIGIVRRTISPDSGVMAVVKANAYGHGLVEVARAAVAAGSAWLAVATVDEGVRLRENGINRPVLVMGPVFGSVGFKSSEIRTLLHYDLTATVYSFNFAAILSDFAHIAGKTANVHIKIDTGMNRLGFKSYDSGLLCREVLNIARLPGLNIQGIYSHLAASESDADFTREQFTHFSGIVADLKGLGLEIPIKHIANSGAVLRHPEFCADLVRVGVLVYGLAPDSTPEGAQELRDLGILPALSFKSRVGHIKTIKGGESVGYGRNFYAADTMEIATIPLGYGDGISRALSNRGKVLINGHFCPIVGNICMDQFMVNATGAAASFGDEVTIIGEGGEQQKAAIYAENIAMWQKSINYEVTTSISQRVERGYLT